MLHAGDKKEDYLMFVTKDAIQKARKADLSEWMERYHPEAVTTKHGSVVLTAGDTSGHVLSRHGFSGYINFHTGERGNSIDYLMRYLGYTFTDAVKALTADMGSCTTSGVCTPNSAVFIAKTESSRKEFELPKSAETMRNVYAYLMSRGLHRETIEMLVRRQLLYQSAMGNNCVFINPKRTYYELRGTNTYADTRCKRRDECKDYCKTERGWCSRMKDCPRYKKDSFHGTGNCDPYGMWFVQDRVELPTDTVYITEAAIDAASLYQIMRGEHKGNNTYVSIGGVGNQRKIDFLKKHYNSVILAVDNDAAGEQCRRNNPDLRQILPEAKDWNSDLMIRNGVKTDDQQQH